ncbi:MAG TPA: HAMP domain-containing sensor histidine kinase [Prolixibacteraceae bacterium]|nr:HAMP domain-containing sensor histidine kinase [Prolixibacteraceae bacterium]
MKIWERIILGFIAVIIVMIIVDVNALMNNIEIIDHVEDLEHSKQIELVQSNKVAYLIQLIKSNQRELFLEIDSGERKVEIIATRKQLETNIQDLLSAIKTMKNATQIGYSLTKNDKDMERELEELAMIDSLSILTSGLISEVRGNLKLQDSGVFNQLKDIFEHSIDPGSNKIQNLISVIIKDVEEDVARAINKLSIKVDKATKFGIYLTILSILLSLAIGLYISRSISKPLYKLIYGTKEIGKGNLETTVNLGTKGELQLLANSFNDMSKELKIRITSINKLNEELEESNQTKDKYFSIIAHDLKNPFNVILGFTDLLVEQYHDFDEGERQEIVRELNKSSKIVYDLLENLLTWSRSQSGKIELHPEDLNLYFVIKNSVTSYSGNAEQKQIALINNISEEINVYADKFTLTVIVNNILNNAIKFTPDGGSVTFSASKKLNRIEVSIKDTGIGMSQKVTAYLLQSEKIASTSGTRNEKGTGLGLALIKDFINKNNGSLEIESMPGQGTDFRFSLLMRM